MLRLLALCLLASMFSIPAFANCDDEIEVGSTLIAKEKITAWIEDGQRHDGYEGCRYNRILVFQNNTGVACSGYTYQYAYSPEADLWSGPSGAHLCVQEQWLPVHRAS